MVLVTIYRVNRLSHGRFQLKDENIRDRHALR